MSRTDIILFWQTIAIWLTFIIASITAYLAWRIGSRQNQINETLQKIEDQVEIYAYPRQVKGNDNWVLLITNVGKLQLYLVTYAVG